MQFVPPLPPEFEPLPPPAHAWQFIACLVFVLLTVELLLWALPDELQRRVNKLRFGPRRKG